MWLWNGSFSREIAKLGVYQKHVLTHARGRSNIRNKFNRSRLFLVYHLLQPTSNKRLTTTTTTLRHYHSWKFIGFISIRYLKVVENSHKEKVPTSVLLFFALRFFFDIPDWDNGSLWISTLRVPAHGDSPLSVQMTDPVCGEWSPGAGLAPL